MIVNIDKKIRNEKRKYDINWKAAKTLSALSSSRVDKYNYLIGKETLPSCASQIIQETKSTYSPPGKVFEKHMKTIKD